MYKIVHVEMFPALKRVIGLYYNSDFIRLYDAQVRLELANIGWGEIFRRRFRALSDMRGTNFYHHALHHFTNNLDL